MLKPRFVIFVETVSGEIIKALTWCKDEQSGIIRARKESENFGFNAVKVWAVPVEASQ